MPGGTNLLGSSQTLDQSVNTVISEFVLRREVKGQVRSTARTLTLKPGEGPSKYINLYNRFTAYTLTDGVDLTLGQQLTDAQTSFTPGEVGLKVILPKTTLRRIADRDLMRNIGEMMDMAYDRKEDTDGVGQFSSWTTTVGGAGTLLSPGHFFAANARLTIGNSLTDSEEVPGPWMGTFHPCQLSLLSERMVPFATTPAGGTAVGHADDGAHAAIAPGPAAYDSQDSLNIVKQGPRALTKIADIDIYANGRISVDGSNDAIGAVYSRQGFIFISEMEPENNKEVDASLRAFEISLVGSYGWGLFRSGVLGVQMKFDSAIPTS